LKKIITRSTSSLVGCLIAKNSMKKIVEKETALRMLFKGVKIDERTRDYIEKRLGKVKKPLDKITGIQIEIDLDKKGKFRAEIMVKTPYNLYRAEETTESIEGSVDIVCGELYQQITKDKNKMIDLRERGARSLKKKVTLDKDSRYKK
jgi:ribosomal subunit interface protein